MRWNQKFLYHFLSRIFHSRSKKKKVVGEKESYFPLFNKYKMSRRFRVRRVSGTYEDATVEDEHHHFEEPGATHGGSWRPRLWKTNTTGERVSARKPPHFLH